MFEISGTRILLTQGDTGILTITTKSDHVFTASDIAVFTIRRGNGSIVAEMLLHPEADGRVQIPFVSDLTDNLRVGAYEWDIRYCIDAVIEDGHVTDAREVITPMRPGVFDLVKAVGRV